METKRITEKLDVPAPQRGWRQDRQGQDDQAPSGHGDIYQTIGVNEQTVYLSRSSMRRGINEHSGKTWCRFRNEAMTIFSWKRGGRMRILSKSRLPQGGYSFFDVTGAIISQVLATHAPALNPDMRALAPYVLEARGQKDLRTLIQTEYPLATEIPAGVGITAHLAQPNVQEFTRSFFGPSRYRRDLVRGVGKRGWITSGGTGRLLELKAFAPLVPVDWISTHLNDLPEPTIYDFMRGGPVYSAPQVAPLRRMLRTATAKQAHRLFKNLAQARDRDRWDALIQFNNVRQYDPEFRLGNISFNSWKTLHDVLPIELRKLKTRNRPIRYTDRGRELVSSFRTAVIADLNAIDADATFPDQVLQTHLYEIIAPPDTHTLIRWGQEMSNCIGGYSDAAQNGTLLYAVLKDGEMIANMEISAQGILRQLVGKHNMALPAEDHDHIIRAIERVFPDAIPDYYTGMPARAPRRGAAFVGAMLDPGEPWNAQAPRVADLANLQPINGLVLDDVMHR